MIITDKAKAIIEETLESNGCDCLQVSQVQSCCGTSLVFNLAKLGDGDEPTTINGVSVLMAEDVKQRAQAVTITVEDGELVIQDEASSGCC